jgi:membrane-associated protein
MAFVDGAARRRVAVLSKFALALVLIGVTLTMLVPTARGQGDGSPTAATSAADPADKPSFFVQILQNLMPGKTRALMETLGQPEYQVAAFIALTTIVFVETGLLIGFFLPGDSLLVTAGLICASPVCNWPLGLLILTLCVAAIVGDSVGYSIGFKAGPKIFCREKSLFFNKDHLLKAQQFYERHGGKTIILARFMPILRTFAPVVAGVGRMEYRRFLFYNLFGGIGWVTSMVLIGYFLPTVINPLLQPIFGPDFSVRDYIEYVIVVVVLLSIAPAGVLWFRNRFKRGADHCAQPAVEPVRDRIVA